jgi:hypothetical protein
MDCLFRDAYNGQWLVGSDKGLIASYCILHNADEPAELTAAQCLSFGIPTGNLLSYLYPLLKQYKWASQLLNWKSLELMVGYRFFGHTPAVYPFVWGIGGKVKQPVDLRLGL